MSQKKALVGNASDAQQVKSAARKERDVSERAMEDMRFVLAQPQGRRVFWRLLEKCRVFNSIHETSSLIHYNAGQQDLGHYIMAEIARADEDKLFLMMKEHSSELAKGV